jgi:hypothetical protein
MLRFGSSVLDGVRHGVLASAFVSALLLTAGVWSASPAKAQNAPPSAEGPSSTQGNQQNDDQSGPPSLRHKDDPQPAAPSAPVRPAPASAQPDSADPNASAPPVAPPPPNAPPLSEQSKLQLLRYVDGEYAKVLTPLPGGKAGMHFKAGAPVDQDSVRKSLMVGGAALNVGDSVQITKVEFHDRDIQFDINYGPKGKTSWRDKVQISGGLGLPVNTSTTTTGQDAPVVPQKSGATIFLDFDRSVPDMTGDQLKAYLSRVLDFSKRSAAVQYVDSLPPKMREAIAAKRAEVGMDHEEVTAALGRPERKVRERDPDGNDTEDWIYGKPPAKTTFVSFQGDKVVRVTEYP